MSFDSLLGNDHNKELLRRALRGGRLPHALIFAGPEGIGKRQFAITLAKAVNCERRPDDSCDKCGSCRRIEEACHFNFDQAGSVDVRIVFPTKSKDDDSYRKDGVIRVKHIRQVSAQAYARPVEGRRRVFIIESAERMHEESMNALLKTLEEPAETSLIILVTAQVDALLPTIRSRCQTLRFAPLTVGEVEQYLAANYKRPAAETRLLARLSQGRIGQARATDLSVYRERREELLELLDTLTGAGDRAKLVKKAEQLARREREREEFEASLDLWCSLLRDVVLLLAAAPPDRLTHVDVQPRLERYAAQLDLTTIARWFDGIEELRRSLRVNINRQVATEALLLSAAADRERIFH